MNELRLYERFPVRTIQRSLIPVVLCVAGIIWMAHATALPWAVAARVLVLVAGFWTALRVVRLATFFAVRCGKAILVVADQTIQIRDVALPWTAISKIEAMRRHGQSLVGIYLVDSRAFLQSLSGLERSFYSQQLKGFAGALPVPPIRGFSQGQVVHLLERYRAGADSEGCEAAILDRLPTNVTNFAAIYARPTPSYLHPASISIIVAIAIFVGLAFSRSLWSLVASRSVQITGLGSSLLYALMWSVSVSLSLYILLTFIKRLDTRKQG